MPDDVFKKLLEFESILKKCILDRFRGILPQNKVDIINSSQYLDKNAISKLSNGSEIQGKILRDMLDSIINLKFVKELSLNEYNERFLLVGEDIEEDILEYYAKDISIRYKFNINFSKDDFTYAKQIKSLLADKFDFIILNKDTEDFFNDDLLKDFFSSYESDLLSKLVKNVSQSEIIEIENNIPTVDETISLENPIEATISNVDVSIKEQPVIIETTAMVDTLPIVEIQENIPVVDEVISLENPIEATISSVSLPIKDETVIGETVPMVDTLSVVEIKNDAIVQPVSSVVATINESSSNNQINDINLVVPNSDTSSPSDNNDSLIELKPDITDANSTTIKEEPTDTSSILSDEKYKELCLKYARDEQITPEELDLLLRSTPQLMDNNQDDIVLSDTSNEVLSQERKVRGFTINSFSSYFVIISIIITLLLIFFIL